MSVDDELAAIQVQHPEVRQAEGMLAVLLRVPIEQAVVSLELRAQFHGVSLLEAAEDLLREQSLHVAGEPVPELEDRAIAILRQHFDCNSSPLERQL